MTTYTMATGEEAMSTLAGIRPGSCRCALRQRISPEQVARFTRTHLVLVLALGALQTEADLLGGLSLLVENGLGLATEASLLPVVTPLA